MVIDSYDTDSFDIRTFFPSPQVCSGSILITSVRSKIASNLSAWGLEIKGLDVDAGSKMLVKYLGDKTPDESSKLQRMCSRIALMMTCQVHGKSNQSFKSSKECLSPLKS